MLGKKLILKLWQPFINFLDQNLTENNAISRDLRPSKQSSALTHLKDSQLG